MKNNFLRKVTKMPQNTGGGNSQTKRATLALPLRYLCAMLLALVLGIGQMWGDPTIPSTTLTLPATGLQPFQCANLTWTGTPDTLFISEAASSGYVIFSPYAIRQSAQTWATKVSSNVGSANGTWDGTDIFKGTSFWKVWSSGDDTSSKKQRYDAFKKNTSDAYEYFRVTNCTGVKIFFATKHESSKKATMSLKVFEITGEPGAEVAEEVTAAANSGEYGDSGTKTLATNATLDKTKNYVIEIHATDAKNKNNISFYEIAFYYPLYTVTYDLNGGDGTTPTEDAHPLGAKFDLHDGVTGITPPTSQAFLKWKDQDDDEYDGGDEYTMPAKNVTLTAQWGTPAATYDITFNNGGHGTAPSAINASKVTLEELSASGWAHTGWVANQTVTVDEAEVTAGTKIANGKTAHLSANTEFTAQWSQLYEIAKGTHTNGDITIDLAEAVAGATVTLTATPDEDYVFSAWDVYKTGESSTKVAVTDNTFTMPAYAVTVNATFAADARTKVLYVTANSADATKANDKLYAALKDTYNVKIVGPTSDVDQSGYALVVLHESIGGGSYSATAVAAAKAGDVPVLNTKSYFYNSDRWGWGTPNAGQSVKGATLNSAYCNIASHPLFSGVTVTDGFFEITDDAAAKCMQPIGEFTSGKEGYTLATTPNSGEGNGCAIHELTPAQRGASAGKYLMISVSNAKLNALNANGQKLFQNAAAYLTGSTTWDPISVPTSPVVAATPTENYTEGGTITLTASAEGTSASTVYTWYKGADWATASATTPVQAASTSGATFSKTAAVEDAGTYWCNISNGISCDAQASVTITVSSASTPTHTISYDNVKGADMTAYPTEYTEGIGVASFDPLADITGWHFVEWSPASIATDATTDQTITAVWAQVFEVTFNLQGHGAEIAKQDIISGEKATEPTAPSAIGYDFGGWYTDEECTAGNEFDFNTSITAATPLYAKWTAFDGCTLLVPALSGDALTVGATVDLQTGSTGGSIKVANLGAEGSIAYNANGLSFSNGGKDSVRVTLNNELKNGSVIKLRIMANGATHNKGRGLNLYNAVNAKKALLGWQADETVASGDVDEFTYTVEEGDGFAGTNIFILQRQNSVFLQSIKVTNCGDPIIFHNLTSAITPDNDPAYATVTLGASSVREGHTTTATYSAIDAAYEFDEWQISGTGASIADASANPAVITMGTADAVVTLKLKVATPKHTVTFNKMGKGADIASQLVAEGALVSEPSVTEPEGWLLEGWYKESTFENKWDFASDVMSTSDIELFANWVADTSIKLINKSTGAINTTNFTTAVAAEADVDGEKGASFSSARSALTAVSALGEMVQYNATTNQAKIQLTMYNTSSAAKTIYLFKLTEGDDAAVVTEIPIEGSSRMTTEYYTFNSDKNRSFYVTVSDAKVKILQVKVVDDGATPMKQFGQAGYSLNFNKGRMFAKNGGSAYPFEGGSIKVSSDYKVLNNSNLATKSYIQFNNAVANTVLKVTRAGGTYYVSQDPENKGTTYNKDEEIVLSATGTWYLGSTSSGSSASFTKIEFLAPKCQKPTVVDMENIGLCEGDAFTALTVSASVTDDGSLHYQWYKHPAAGDDEAVGTDAATYTPTADGQYYVVVTNQLAGYSDNSKASNMVTVEHFASAVITTAPLNQRGLKDAEVTLSVAATGKNLSYAWFTCDNEAGDNPVAVVPAATGTSLNVTITEGMSQWYKVVVTSDCGNASATAKVEEFVPATPANVTESIVWDWNSSAWPASGQAAFTDQVEDGTDLTPAYELLADADAIVPNNAAFRSDMLYGKGQWVWRSGNKFFQGTAIKFTTEVAGLVRVNYRSTGNNKEVQVTIAGTPAGKNKTSNFQWSEYVEVPAGDVEILCLSTDANKSLTRVQKIEFLALAHRRTAVYSVGELGTICLEDDAKAVGANVYELLGHDENGKMVFDQILSGEIEAGKPYLFQATNASQVSFYKKVNATHADDAGSLKGMYGTFVDKDLYPATDVDMFYFSGTHIWAVKDFTVESITIPAYRCYVNYAKFMENPVGSSTPLPGRKRMLIGVNGAPAVATGVENAAATDKPAKMLINGQLFILRGEKMYDAKGQLVK